jgi:hypothetical protein
MINDFQNFQMSRYNFNLILILVAIFICQCKKNENNTYKEHLILDSKKEIGFVCGYRAEPTALVAEIIEYYGNGKYEDVRLKLYSNDASEAAVGLIFVNFMQSENNFKLRKEDIPQIEKIKQSNAVINLCDGCMEQNTMTLKELFSEGHKDFQSIAVKAIKRSLISRSQKSK